MNEASKAMRRRWCEHERGEFPWRDFFRGEMLDVGAGDDCLPFPTCKPFDVGDGDANKLSSYFSPESFDLIHASQCLEHLHDPFACVADWLTLLRPGGHLIATVPDWVAYEGMTFPSRYNGDHKSSWSMIYRGSAVPIHVHIPTLCAGVLSIAESRLMRFVDSNYDYKIGTSRDQTFPEGDGVEAFNEFVLRKR